MRTRKYIPRVCCHCRMEFKARTDATGKYCSKSCATAHQWKTGNLIPHGNKIDWNGTPIERFMKFVSPEPNTGCWLWVGANSSNRKWPYGSINVGRKMIRAHHRAWKLFKGAIPTGMRVLHKCDVTLCVNPEHLFLGTDKDNVQDMIKKGRGLAGRVLIRGSLNTRAKLTEQQVLSIISDKRVRKDIAHEYGVSKSCIAMIKQKRNWKHLHALEDTVRI